MKWVLAVIFIGAHFAASAGAEDFSLAGPPAAAAAPEAIPPDTASPSPAVSAGSGTILPLPPDAAALPGAEGCYLQVAPNGTILLVNPLCTAAAAACFFDSSWCNVCRDVCPKDYPCG